MTSSRNDSKTWTLYKHIKGISHEIKREGVTAKPMLMKMNILSAVQTPRAQAMSARGSVRAARVGAEAAAAVARRRRLVRHCRCRPAACRGPRRRAAPRAPRPRAPAPPAELPPPAGRIRQLYSSSASAKPPPPRSRSRSRSSPAAPCLI